MDESFKQLLQSEKDADKEIIDALDKKVYDLRNLIELGLSLASNLDFNNLVSSILYSCIGQLFIENVAILLKVDIDTPDFYVHTAKGYDGKVSSTKVILDGSTPLVQYLTKSLAIHEYSSLLEIEGLHDDILKLEHLKPDVIVPMKWRDTMNGLIILGKKINDLPKSKEEKEFIQGLAQFAAIAVENSRLYQMATKDRMTRLYIHHFFQERLLDEFQRTQRYGSPLSLIMLDIDHFKKFNDTYGHQQGDSVLKETAQIIMKSVRNYDIPARYGGEEFAIILPETDMEHAIDVATRLRKDVEQHEFTGQTEALHVTISLGVAEFKAGKDKTPKHLIERADRALYKAKKSGRNRVAAFR